MTFQEERSYIGHLNQLFGVKTYRLTGGRQEGVAAVDIATGAGLEFTVLADRCMDLFQLKLDGQNLNYFTPAGPVAPAYYDGHGDGWLRSNPAGFLNTCGLTNIGVPSEDGGETVGLHGRVDNLPAERFSVDLSMEDGVPCARLKGVMTEAALFGTCLTLTREIVCRYGENRIELTDTVENIGPRTAPHMILYHFNMGYPLLCEDAVLHIPTKEICPRNAHAAQMKEKWNVIDPPQPDEEESCFYHRLETDAEGFATVGLDNPARHIGVRLRFDAKALPHFVQWRMLGEREYVTGLEPANAPIDGRDNARAEGTLPFLAPGEKKVYRLSVEAVRP